MRTKLDGRIRSSCGCGAEFPLAYLHEIEEESLTWRLDYIEQFLRRDLPLLAGTQLSDEQLRRLPQLIAHKHGQYWNHSEAGQIIGVSYKTVQRHLEILKGAYILRELPPFHSNQNRYNWFQESVRFASQPGLVFYPFAGDADAWTPGWEWGVGSRVSRGPARS